MDLEGLGKIILTFAVVLAIVGGLFYFLGKGLGLSCLPGDIVYRKGSFGCYFPIVTCILLSILLTLLLNLFFFFFRK